MDKNNLYRMIPKVDILLAGDQMKVLTAQYGKECVREAIQEELDALRNLIRLGKTEQEIVDKIKKIDENVDKRVEEIHTPKMKKVVNATGTILHTNLGRAPLSEEHTRKLMGIVAGYSNLEYNLEEGKRGERYAHFEQLLCKVTGAEAAIAVNNNASAVLLILNSLAKGGEVIVSRGELVEIGGSFRIPDVMGISGAKLSEIGTTNKTHLADYENAVSEETKVFLKVHTSNYKIVGFTESVEVEQIVPLSEKYKIPVVEDLGSGILINMEKYGLSHEPTVQEALLKGVDVVCFSGDKLLGGPQAGIIVGKKKYIDLMKKNQLSRAFRIDKFTAAALELVLQEYLSEEKAIQNIPVLKMITKSLDDVKKGAEELSTMLKKSKFSAQYEVIFCESQVGGGAFPTEVLPSYGVAVTPDKISTAKLEILMRQLPVPVIGRIVDDQMILDVRTLEKKDFEITAEMFKKLIMLEEDCQNS
ncbi:MAG: L-seryl-tRNA(Sec) selenium transferase [Schaedlerella sp.]|nr:L-seryl-tRNA(Sec) selenium transferase [Schaedlerella sp.]